MMLCWEGSWQLWEQWASCPCWEMAHEPSGHTEATPGLTGKVTGSQPWG